MALARFFPSLILLIAVAVFFAPESKAQSNKRGWSICNETSFVIEIATGRQSGNDVIIEGWTRVRPGGCEVALAGPFRSAPYFLYARSSRAHRGGTRYWGGEYDFCVDATGSFSVESPPDCVAMGLETRNFQPVKIDSRQRWQTTLKETQKYTRQRALAAGIQRLLGDAGIASGSIDGYIGRRTRRSVAEFLRSNDLPANTGDTELIDYLEQVAIDRARNLGFTLCNRSENRIWSAIGRRRGDGWESRGWWGLEAGSCERVIDEELINTNHFVYAEMETEDGLKILEGALDRFCIQRSRFAIRGREECSIRFQDEVSFMQTAPAEEGRLVFEFFDRDFVLKPKPVAEDVAP